MDHESDHFPPDPHENLKRYTPHTEALGFELQAASTKLLGEVERIGPDITAEQFQPLQYELVNSNMEAFLLAFAALELEVAKLRTGITDDDLDAV